MTVIASLSQLVAAQTKSAHTHAESRPFMSQLLAGALSVRDYVGYLGALAPVYKELERQLREHNDEASIALFDHRRLDRYERICADLKGFGQDATRATLSRSSVEYVESLKSAAISPQRLIAHHYTRYLGDLAGGQVIARCIVQHYEIPTSLLTFYDFTDLGDVVHYRRRYKSLLDLVPWTLGERQEFINEVSRAFELNAAIFDELGGLGNSHQVKPTHFLALEKLHSPR